MKHQMLSRRTRRLKSLDSIESEFKTAEVWTWDMERYGQATLQNSTEGTNTSRLKKQLEERHAGRFKVRN